MAHLVFSFGTLRQDDVQRSLFGGRVASTVDAVTGYRVGRVRISDPVSIEASGSDVHPALIATGDPLEVVEGEVLQLSDDELAAVDRYEEVSFERVEVVTRSGLRAVAYKPKAGLSLEP